MPERILITGGTGAFGRCLVRALLEQSDASLVLLVRGNALSPSEALRTFLAMEAPPALVRRIRLVSGDVTRPNLGMSPEDSTSLQATVDAVIHGAAITRFDEDHAISQAINVGGTMRMLCWARRASRIKRVGFLSTVYVAGRRTGLILESERAHNAGFVNAYEASKYDAEAKAEHARSDLPIAIYRLSTILGDSVSGRVDRFTAPHFALRLLWLGLVPMVPGAPDYPVDLLTSDHAASAVAELFLERFAAGQRFHLAASPERRWPLQRLINAAHEIFAMLNPDWARGGHAEPALVDAETYRLFLQTVESTGNPLFQQVLTQLHSFSEQLLCPKEFDMGNLTAVLPAYAKQLPPLEDYFPKVLAYCVRNEWGRRRADPRADLSHPRQAR